jgi:hypothetical protein
MGRFIVHRVLNASLLITGMNNQQGNKVNNAVNSGEFFVRSAHYKCAGYGWR